MGNYNSINDAVRAKIDKLIEEKGLDKKDYLYTADVASSLNQLASIMGGSGDSMTIADSLYDVLDSADGAGGGSGGDFAGLINRTITTASNSQLTSIGMNAFNGCYSLSEISFPNCQIVHSNAFQSCYQLSNVYLPNVEALLDGAFQQCYMLENISFPGCKTIGASAFYDCSNLTSAIFPLCFTINGGAFDNAVKLKVVSFPACITIYDYAFKSCKVLSGMYFLGNTVPSINSYTFSNTTINDEYATSCYIYVRESMLSAFKSASYWSKYSSKMIGLTDSEIEELDNA